MDAATAVSAGIRFDGWQSGGLEQALSPDAMLYVDHRCRPAAVDATQTGLTLWLSTRAAAREPVAFLVASTLASHSRWLDARRWDVEGVLQEALGNAVVHGSLGIPSDLRGSLSGLVQFGRKMEAGLADPAKAALPILVRAEWTDQSLTMQVADQGDGFDPVAWVPPPGARYGRGLATIRGLCADVGFADGGRRISMTLKR